MKTTDRSALIRLASSMSKGSEERQVLLRKLARIDPFEDTVDLAEALVKSLQIGGNDDTPSKREWYGMAAQVERIAKRVQELRREQDARLKEFYSSW